MRRSIQVEGLSHGGLPIPAASRVGPMVVTGGIRGVDRETGELPSTIEAQASLMFDNLLATIQAADGAPTDIVKVNVWLASSEGREAINEPWLRHFPDPDSRPARHIVIHTLPGGMLVQCDAIAFVESK